MVLLVAYLAWGAWEGTLSAWFASFDEEWLSKYFNPQPRGLQGLLFLGYFLLGCGGLPALGLIYLLWRGSPWQRTVATFVLAYLAIILGCGLKNLHYLGPLLPLTVTLWLTAVPVGTMRARGEAGSSVRRMGFSPSMQRLDGLRPLLRKIVHVLRGQTLTAIGLAASLWLSWPPVRPTFTLNRELGRKTLFLTNDYAEACRWARIRFRLYHRGDVGWEFSQHTWAGYAARSAEAKATFPLCVTDGSPPAPGYELVFLSVTDGRNPADGSEGARLYCRDPDVRKWLANQRPLTGRERFSRVFLPIAPEPEPNCPW